MSNVTSKHAEYDVYQEDWKLVSAIVAGEREVKKQGETLLPNPISTDESNKDNIYKKYKQRASLYNATSNTLDGLIGTAFRNMPTIEVPDSLDYITKDIDGNGVNIFQQSQSATEKVLEHGRAGLLTDYPKTDGETSRADKEILSIKPRIILINASNVINWRYTRIGGVSKLSLLVIKEGYEEIDDFKVENKTQYRVLSLTEGVYTITIYRKVKDEWVVYDEFIPRQGNGSTWNEIPFVFIGSKNNDGKIDKSPLLDLAHQNIKHYQVGADWYNALHWAGQPQPAMTGLTEAWRDWLQKEGVIVGSRSILPLPEGGDFKIVTVSADSALQTELEKIEDRMIALGARVITIGGAAKTATEASADNEKQYSVLSLVAENVSDAYTKALNWMLMFENAAGDVKYSLHTDYVEHKADAQLITALVQSWQSGALPQPDLWQQLRKYGLIEHDKTDDEIQGELDSEMPGLPLEE